MEDVASKDSGTKTPKQTMNEGGSKDSRERAVENKVPGRRRDLEGAGNEVQEERGSSERALKPTEKKVLEDRKERKVPKKTRSHGRVSPEGDTENGTVSEVPEEKVKDLEEAEEEVGTDDLRKLSGPEGTIATENEGFEETTNKVATTVSGGIKEVTKVDPDVIKSNQGVKAVAVVQETKTTAAEKPSVAEFCSPPPRSNHACGTNHKVTHRPSREDVLRPPKRSDQLQ